MNNCKRFSDFHQIVGKPHNLVWEVSIQVKVSSIRSRAVLIQSGKSSNFFVIVMNGIQFEWLPP
jgi:hypothetical protein